MKFIPTPTFRLCTVIMCGSKGCLGALGVVVALLATLAARPELILPHKIHAAVRAPCTDPSSEGPASEEGGPSSAMPRLLLVCRSC
eukprot:COSAG04_NODE_6901_length_1232_cov_1.429832_3_plen_86_part_00